MSARERCRQTPADDGDGHVDPIDPRVETFEEMRDRVVEVAESIAPDCLGTTDDCGFAPFADDSSTSRDIAFEKIRARVVGTQLAAAELGISSAGPCL